MKNGKTEGLDNVPTEVLKVDPHATADILLPLFQYIWQKEKFPKEWKEMIIKKSSTERRTQSMQKLEGYYYTCSD
jgi:hypothetical protein